MIEYENLYKLNKQYASDFRRKLDDILNNGKFILGNHGDNFEKQFATYCGAKFCVGVGNGMDALMLALKSFSFPEGSEVVVSSNTYIASIFAIINSNLKPVLVEPDIATYNLDPFLLQHAITEKTVAVVAVHLYGKCCDMENIGRIASSNNLVLIEDCAQSHGAKFRQKIAGTFGQAGAFSFYPTKNLGALGDGGCVVTNASETAYRIGQLRNYGSSEKYYNELKGVNSRLDELQAAFLSVKLVKLDEINAQRRKLAMIYSKELKDDFIKPTQHDDYFDVHHIYNVRHSRRDKLKEYLLKNEIMTEIHYPVPPHKQKALQDLFGGKSFPVSEEIHNTTLSLPISSIHSEEDIERVVAVMNKF